jgi:uncharacterized membrane protein (UPF0127 family)
MKSPQGNISGAISDAEARLEVVNLTRGTVLATNLEVANTGAKRNKGLLGRNALGPGEGLWIIPCESVHTFFMQFTIDLVYLDRKHRIRKVKSDVRPWRMSACLSAHSILELPQGTIRASGSRKGDTIEFSSARETDDRADKVIVSGLASVESLKGGEG